MANLLGEGQDENKPCAVSEEVRFKWMIADLAEITPLASDWRPEVNSALENGFP